MHNLSEPEGWRTMCLLLVTTELSWLKTRWAFCTVSHQIQSYSGIFTKPPTPTPPQHLCAMHEINAKQQCPGQYLNAKENSDFSRKQHYLNQPAFNELLISREKAMIDFRKHHLISQVRSKVEVQRWESWRISIRRPRGRNKDTRIRLIMTMTENGTGAHVWQTPSLSGRQAALKWNESWLFVRNESLLYPIIWMFGGWCLLCIYFQKQVKQMISYSATWVESLQTKPQFQCSQICQPA